MQGIPVEILSQIFHEAVLQALSWESIRVPVRISHVCRLWREVSLLYGSLWASLSIKYDGSGRARRRTALTEALDTFLRRTGGSGLDFSVSFELIDEEDREEHYFAERIVKRLFSQQRRWWNVAFVWRFTAYSDDFADVESSGSEMPMLRSLVLDADIIDRDGRLICPYIDISQSSRLAKICLAGKYFLRCGDQPISTMTENITLEFRGRWEVWRVERVCLDLLKIAPRCTSLRAKFDHHRLIFAQSVPAQQDNPGQIIHNVKRLGLDYVDLPPSLLSKLVLPSLEDLFFVVDEYQGQGAGEVLSTCIQRSLPPLLDLKLCGDGVDEQSLVDSLRLLPTLRSLTLYSIKMSARLFEELTCYGDDNVSSTFDRRITCPSLKKLEIHTPLVYPPAIIPACADAFCSMVQSRWKCLKSFNTVAFHKKRTDVCSIRQFQEDLEYCFDIWEKEDRIVAQSTS